MPEIQMPKLSDTMTEGTLVAWKKKKGDKVSAGDVIAEIETDKATMEWESPEDGTLTEIYVEEGGKVDVGQRIAFIGEEGEAAPKEEKKAPEKKEEPPEKEAKKPEKPKKEQAETEKAASAKAEEKETAPPQEKGKPVEAGVSSASESREKRAEPEQPARPPLQESEARVKASPVARRIAAELGVDLGSVKGTGPEGRVTEGDVRAAAKAVAAVADRGQTQPPRPAAPKPGPGSRIQLSGMRKGIAERLVQSKAPIPHFLSQHRYRRRPANGSARRIEIGRGRFGHIEDHGERFRFESGSDGGRESSKGQRIVRYRCDRAICGCRSWHRRRD